MKKTLIVSIIFLFLLTSCTQQDVVKNQPKELLYVWLHDVGFEGPNFLAVINADSESENYGELVDTIPVFETVGMAHNKTLSRINLKNYFMFGCMTWVSRALTF